jgi:hypothetical protein
VKVFLTNHQPETLNYKYGRNKNNMTTAETTHYIYEKRCEHPGHCDYACTDYTSVMGVTDDMQSVIGTNCDDRLEPTNDNNTVNFRAFNECNHGSASCTTPITT